MSVDELLNIGNRPMKDYSVTHRCFSFTDIKCSLHGLNEHCQSSDSLIAVIDGDTQQVVMIECHYLENNEVPSAGN